MALPITKLDSEQVIKGSYDEANQRLRVDAQVSATISDVAIKDSDGNEWNINPDGSGDVNIVNPIQIEISAADGDNIAISDGTNTLVVNPDGSINTQFSGTVTVQATNLDIRDLNSATDSVTAIGPLTDAELRATPVAVSATDLDIRNLNSATDSVTAIGPLTDTELRASPVNVAATNLDIRDLTFAQDKVDVSGSSVAISGSVTLDEPVLISGTDDGTITGTEYGYVYNQKSQIMASEDREETYTYADFGNKNQRFTRIEYASPTFPGFIVRRDFNYVLDGGKYRLTTSVWTIV